MKTSESKEDIKKQNVPTNLDIKEKVIIDKFKKKNKKLCLLKLFSISFMIFNCHIHSFSSVFYI